MAMSPRAIIIVWLAVVATAPGGAQDAGYTFINIVDSTSRFANEFGLPSINESGAIGFQAAVDTGSTGIFSVRDGAITRIARVRVPILSHLIYQTPINARGRVAFTATILGKGSGLFSGRGGPIKTLAVAPRFSVGPGTIDINDSGQVCFQRDRGHWRGIFISEPDGTVTTVFLSNRAPFSPATINNSATVAFRAWLYGGPDIFTIKDGIITLAAGTRNLSEGGLVSINDAGTIAFTAFEDGIFTATGGETTMVAPAGRFGTLFRQIGPNVSINNHGNVVFEASTHSTLGIFTGPDPQRDKVISPGDTLFGGSVTATAIGATALNDAGQIVFRYHLDDGRGGIAVATPEVGP